MRVNDIINFERAKIDIHNYTPEFKNADKLPDRVWFWNLGKFCSYLSLVNTLLAKDFKALVMKTIQEHDKELITKKKMEVEVASEFYELFQGSETVSSKSSTFKNLIEETGLFGSLLNSWRKKEAFPNGGRR